MDSKYLVPAIDWVCWLIVLVLAITECRPIPRG
jgi:hypothetical protein